MTSSAASGAKWDSRYSHAVVHDASYYGKCLIGGALACGVTHTAVCPLDVVKCNMQVDPVKYPGLGAGFRTVMAEEGAAGLAKGWLPTAIGYHAQGMFKFGFNELFKDQYANVVGQEASIKYRAIIWAASSASAEVIADVALCPFEMVKVKVQTSPPGTFPTGFGSAWATMSADKAQTGFPYGSLKPLWSRQIPYTVAKFVGFEYCVEQFYTHVLTEPKDSYSKATQLGVTFASGYIAGVGCAIVSQPADNLVSQMGKEANRGKSFGQMAGEQGMAKLFLGGLGPRVLMVGTLTGLQWWIYDTYKTVMGLGTSGGAAKK